MSEEHYTGRFSVRIPRSVHKALHKMAKKEGVSINYLVGSILAERMGQNKAVILEEGDDSMFEPE